MAQQMGVGAIGVGDPNVIFKRKFRWTLTYSPNGNCAAPSNSQMYFVKVASRPSYTIEDIEVPFMNDRLFVPGRFVWEPLNITFLDTNQFGAADLLNWLTTLYDFSKTTTRTMSSKRSGYTAQIILNMLDGCGSIMETWTIKDAWPTTMNFGDVDYGSSDIADIQVTLRYSDVNYTSACGTKFSPCTCVGC